MKKKRVLLLTSNLPYPPISGGLIKTYKLIQHLQHQYELSMLCILKDEDSTENVEKFEKLCNFKELLLFKYDKKRTIYNFLKSILVSKPLSVYRNFNRKKREMIKNRLNEYDYVIVDHFFMFEYAFDIPKEKIIYHAHNAEYVLWERFSEENIGLKKIAIKWESKRIKKYERKICNGSNFIFASTNDIEKLKEVSQNHFNFIETLHLGNEDLLDYPNLNFRDLESSILFIGTLTWGPNLDGIKWFLNNVWPSLHKQDKDIRFYIIGKYDNHELKSIVSKLSNVHLLGFVDNLEDYFQKAKVFISPLQYGSGIKVKNIEALYRGIPLVTTEIGVEGIDIKDGKEVFIVKNPDEYINSILNLLQNEEIWTSTRDESRKLAKNKYCWDQVLKNFDLVLNKRL